MLYFAVPIFFEVNRITLVIYHCAAILAMPHEQNIFKMLSGPILTLEDSLSCQTLISCFVLFHSFIWPKISGGPTMSPALWAQT